MIADWLAELQDAFNAAGLDASISFDPYPGPGVRIGAPALSWADHVPRVACGDLTIADVAVIVHVVAHGWAPEQLSEQLANLETVLRVLPGKWRAMAADPAPGDITLPEYRVRIER